MITFGLNYDVKQEGIEEFEKIAQTVLGAMGSFQGHVNTVLYTNVNKTNSYLIYSEWETNEDFKAFMSSQAFKDVQNMSVDLLENRPRHKVYEARKTH